MPKIFNRDGFKFFFYSNEGNPREPLHVHIKKGENNAKFWIKPVIGLAENYGFSSKEINWIEEQVVEELKLIEDTWNDFFSE
jgi:hypothetical protein